jgi:hypothetical protein
MPLELCAIAGQHMGTDRRSFRDALGLQRGDAAWLRDVLLEAARAGEWRAIELVTSSTAEEAGPPLNEASCSLASGGPRI